MLCHTFECGDQPGDQEELSKGGIKCHASIPFVMSQRAHFQRWFSVETEEVVNGLSLFLESLLTGYTYTIIFRIILHFIYASHGLECSSQVQHALHILLVCMSDLNLPPNSLPCRSYGRGYEPLYQAGQARALCTGRKYPSPGQSTRIVHPGPDWCRSWDMCWNNVDMPGGKQPQHLLDWASSLFVQPPCSTALPQRLAPLSGCPSRPITPSAKEPAFCPEEKSQKEWRRLRSSGKTLSSIKMSEQYVCRIRNLFFCTWKMDIQMCFNLTQHFDIFFPSSLILNPKNKSSVDHKPPCIHPPAETVLLDLWSGSSWSSVEPSWVGERHQHGGREAVSQGETPN